MYEGKSHVTVHCDASFSDECAANLDAFSIKSLRLINCDLVSDSTLEVLSDRLVDCLEDLELFEISFSDKGFIALRHLKRLTSLAIYNCGDLSREGILTFLKERGRTLRKLDFRVNSQVDSDIVQDIVEYCPYLNFLEFSSGFGDTGLLAIGEGLPDLEKLKLTCCAASDNCFGKIMKLLRNLKLLDLQFGNYTDYGLCCLPLSVTHVTLTFISEVTDVALTWMLKNLKLTDLSIDRCGIEGTEESIRAFLDCPTLTSVTLTPFLTDEHLQTLVRTNITTFNLFSNEGITDVGAALLRDKPDISMAIFTDCSVSDGQNVIN